VTAATGHDETTMTITSASPGLIATMRRATVIAAEHGHNYVCAEDVLAAMLEDTPNVLQVHWQRRGLGALTFDELRALAVDVVPGPSAASSTGPARAATVEFEVSGPHEQEMRRVIERRR
jgi:hypothetical protein